jgi:IS30 family transposase
MKDKKYSRLSFTERVKIETLLKEKKSYSYIALKIGRARSTVSREVNKWICSPLDKYNARIAQFIAHDDYLNKRNITKIEGNPRLKFYIYKHLLLEYTPEQIAGRLKLDYPCDIDMRISYESIYAHIYKKPQAKLNRKLIKLLVRGKNRRFKKKKRRGTGSKIVNRVSIDLRPEHINNRSEIGHLEGLVIGAKHGSAIGTLVERKTRFVYIIKIPNKKSKTVTDLFAKTINQLNSKHKKTLTYDNGIEMANHLNFTNKTGMPIYFAHPYSSWERGTNENTNGLIRRYFPKGTNFNHVSQKQLLSVQNKLNNRPRKILGFRTPNEAMFQVTAT